MSHRHAPAKLPSAKGAAAKSAPGCPSAVQRLKGFQRMLPWSLAGAFTFAPHRRPNLSVKRTVNGGPRLAVSGYAMPPLSAAYLER